MQLPAPPLLAPPLLAPPPRPAAAAAGPGGGSSLPGGARDRGPRPATRASAARLGVAASAIALVAAACVAAPAATPPIVPGSSAAPREVIVVMRDYAYVPPIVDLVPGETVILRVVNGGLVVHEAILGSLEEQLGWEAAEAATIGAPPGPTPFVPPPPGFRGTRIVVASGERVDLVWTVPVDLASVPGGWFVGCHIPGHWEKGMVAPVRLVGPDGVPLPTAAP